MDIEVYQNGNYVTTFYDIPDSADAVLDFLCDFCSNEGYSIGNQERKELAECAQELLAGGEISLCGFEMRRDD